MRNAPISFLLCVLFVIAIAWSLAPLLVIDKGESPMQAISKSNDYTYGKKWTIFLGTLIVALVVGIALFIVLKLLLIV